MLLSLQRERKVSVAVADHPWWSSIGWGDFPLLVIFSSRYLKSLPIQMEHDIFRQRVEWKFHWVICRQGIQGFEEEQGGNRRGLCKRTIKKFVPKILPACRNSLTSAHILHFTRGRVDKCKIRKESRHSGFWVKKITARRPSCYDKSICPESMYRHLTAGGGRQWISNRFCLEKINPFPSIYRWFLSLLICPLRPYLIEQQRGLVVRLVTTAGYDATVALFWPQRTSQSAG